MSAPCIRARKRKGKGKFFRRWTLLAKFILWLALLPPPLRTGSPLAWPISYHIISCHAMPCNISYVVHPRSFQYVCLSSFIFFTSPTYHSIQARTHERKRKKKEGVEKKVLSLFLVSKISILPQGSQIL
jgi:hypothetical protein